MFTLQVMPSAVYIYPLHYLVLSISSKSKLWLIYKYLLTRLSYKHLALYLRRAYPQRRGVESFINNQVAPVFVLIAPGYPNN
ncbi:hypothetical protein NIES2111_67520 (plasmid) [Nostoc sp. NIES-2111]|nr:hypothetical protein NIES2111_67520 [Nostoc sp. NIES-2111]